MAPTIHASAACLGNRGVLIRGASGSGKSTLLLALLDRDPTARLVADDRVALAVEGGRLVARAPAAIAGRLEVRGLGIVPWPYVESAPVALVVDIVPHPEAPRLPDDDEGTVELEGQRVPRIFVVAGAPEAGARVRAALVALSL